MWVMWVMWGAASILFCCARCSSTLVWARGSRSSRRSPHRVAVPSGGGGASPRLRGGEGPRLWLPSWGGCGGGVGGPPPRPLSGLSGRGGGGGGAFGPLATPPDSQGGGRYGSPGPGGKPSAGGSRPSPAPLYLEPDPRAGPRWGPSPPRPSCAALASRGRPCGLAVSGWRAAGKQVPPRARFLHPPFRGRWHAVMRRAVPWGGHGSGGPAPPATLPHPPSGPSPALPLVWGLGLWRRRVAPAVAPVGKGAAQSPGEPVVGIRIRDAEHRSAFQEGWPRRLPVGPRRPDH